MTTYTAEPEPYASARYRSRRIGKPVLIKFGGLWYVIGQWFTLTCKTFDEARVGAAVYLINLVGSEAARVIIERGLPPRATAGEAR